MAEKYITNETAAGSVQKMEDEELAGVAGGWEMPTIIDTCKQHYDYAHCCNNFGECSHLVIASSYVDRGVRHIVCSCDLGYFNGVSDTHKIGFFG